MKKRFFSKKIEGNKNSSSLSLQPLDQMLLEPQKMEKITFFFEKKKGEKEREEEEMKALKEGERDFSLLRTTFVSFSLSLFLRILTSFTAHFTAQKEKTNPLV